MKYFLSACLIVSSCISAASADDKFTREDMVSKDGDQWIIHPKPVAEEYRNPWPDDLEKEYRQRASDVLKGLASAGQGRGNTYFENEKRTYGFLMAEYLAGRDKAIEILQQRDAQAGSWHKHTLGIDYYACFTIKHQMRKYFYFGHELNPAYRKTMYDGAKIWTKDDPLRKPHHSYQRGKQGWGPDARNSWVDTRGTENLASMRWTSVYLMAEETGNEQTRLKYKEQILTYARGLYRIGMGEWDSENYLGHTITPWHNVYDFAKDPEVKMASKAILDWLYTAAAYKYYRGGYNGPTKRDYNHVNPFSPVATLAWVYFGDAPQSDDHHWESDEVHLITSAYRPPLAVMKLARKAFDRPRELLASKSGYSEVQRGKYDAPAEFHETQYIGKTFLLGSLAEGTSTDGGDVNGFKIMTYSEKRGVNDIQAVPGPDPKKVGSPQYGRGKVSGRNRVAQLENLGIWLVKDPASPWLWVLPDAIEVEQKKGVTFLKSDKTWLAILPINMTIQGVDEKLTEQIQYKHKGGKIQMKNDKPVGDWIDHKVLAGKGDGKGAFSGFAIEIGEGLSYSAFKSDVLGKTKLTVEDLQAGRVRLTCSTGKTLGFAWGDQLADFTVIRDGKVHDWKAHGSVIYDEVGKTPAEALLYQ
ncbi:MAG: hypothetical protein ACLFUJ_13485, partial [Phycisphaerae bacterium]